MTNVPLLFVPVVVATAVGIAGSVLAAADPALKCESSKNKVMAKYGTCLFKAHEKALKKDLVPDVVKCDRKLSDGLSKAEDKVPGACPVGLTENELRENAKVHHTGVFTDLSDCTGAKLGGGCWYLAADGENCRQTCEAQSGDLAYHDLLGELARRLDNEMCQMALTAVLGNGPDFVAPPEDCAVTHGDAGLGCFTSGALDTAYICTAATTDTANASGVRRVCPCERVGT